MQNYEGMEKDSDDLTIRELYNLITKSQEINTKKITEEINNNRLEYCAKLEQNQQNIKQLRDEVLHLERQRRKNNIIVFGLPLGNRTADEIEEETVSILNNLLRLTIEKRDINNLYELGKGQKKGILIQFVSYLTKKKIFKNISHLKGTKIGIAHDLCPHDREQNKILVKHLKEAKSNNKSAKIKKNKLEIDNQLYSIEELENSEFFNDTSTNSEKQSTEDEVSLEPERSESIQEKRKPTRSKGKHKKTTPKNTRLTAKKRN